MDASKKEFGKMFGEKRTVVTFCMYVNQPELHQYDHYLGVEAECV